METDKNKATSLVGPVLLALLINSGQIKTSPIFAWLPVDLTLVLALVVGVLFLLTRAKLGPTTGWIAVPLVLWTLFLVPLAWTPIDEFTALKVGTLFTLTLLLAVAPFQLLREDRQRRAFLLTTIIIALSFVVITVIVGPTYSNNYSDRIVFEGANTIGTARVAMAGALVMVLYAFRRSIRTHTRLLLGTAAVLTSMLGVMTGSRGPVLAAVIATLAVLLFTPLFQKYRGRALLAATLVGASIVWIGIRSSSDGLDRIINGSSTSDAARQTLWSRAVDIIGREPFGIGWGMYSTPELGRGYPHNIVLEIGAEAGWASLIAFVVILIATAIRGAYCATTSTSGALFGLYIFALLNALVSEDINGTRLLWVAMSAIWVLGWPQVRESAALKPIGSSHSGGWSDAHIKMNRRKIALARTDFIVPE